MITNELQYKYYIDSQPGNVSVKRFDWFIAAKYTSSFRSLQFFIAAIISVCAMGLLAPAAQACKCELVPSTHQAVERAARVFRGKVLSVKTITFLPEGYQYRQVKFLLKHLWKGENRLTSLYQPKWIMVAVAILLSKEKNI